MTDAAGRRALLICNPASRSGRLADRSAKEKLRNIGFDLIEPACRRPSDVSPCIVSFRDQVGCVVVAGGDGTLNAAARGLAETGLPLGVLPLGTANDFARSVGIPMDLDAAIRIIAEGLVHRVDLGEVNGHPFLNVASIGLAAELAKSLTRDRKRWLGRLSYALAAIRVLLNARPFHATLIDGETKAMVRTMQIAVGNGRYYGGGNVILSDAQIDDGRLDLYSLEFAQVWRMALMIRSFKLGEHAGVREVRTARGSRFEVVTRKPRPINADGELVTQTPAVFTQRTRAVSVYVPETCPLVRTPS